MKFDDPIRSSAFEWLVFPVAGGVSLSAMATAGIVVRPSRKSTNGKQRQGRASKRLRIAFLLFMALAALLGDANLASSARAASVGGDALTNTQIGIASWYGAREAGRKTASGAIFNPGRLSAAHRTLKLGTCVRVTDLANARFVIAPVIDRGPYIRGRLIDLSESAAQMLGMKQVGLAQVRIEVVASCRKDMNAKPV